MASVAVITFPGSNGDHDAWHAFQHDIGVEARLIDYRETSLRGFDAVILPGGFSYGDHLRCGAIARFAPIMEEIQAFADRGGPVLGICNGFQILTEFHLLPGALIRNETLRFHCLWQTIRVESSETAWTSGLDKGSVLRLPVAHGDGAYFAAQETVDQLEANGQVVFRYCDEFGSVGDTSNPNGSVHAIAGVSNAEGNVVGMMPHPERATTDLIGGSDGLDIVKSVLNAVHLPA